MATDTKLTGIISKKDYEEGNWRKRFPKGGTIGVEDGGDIIEFILYEPPETLDLSKYEQKLAPSRSKNGVNCNDCTV